MIVALAAGAIAFLPFLILIGCFIFMVYLLWTWPTWPTCKHDFGDWLGLGTLVFYIILLLVMGLGIAVTIAVTIAKATN